MQSEGGRGHPKLTDIGLLVNLNDSSLTVDLIWLRKIKKGDISCTLSTTARAVPVESVNFLLVPPNSYFDGWGPRAKCQRDHSIHQLLFLESVSKAKCFSLYRSFPGPPKKRETMDFYSCFCSNTSSSGHVACVLNWSPAWNFKAELWTLPIKVYSTIAWLFQL